LQGDARKKAWVWAEGEAEEIAEENLSSGSRQEKESNLRPRVFSVSGEGE
jgi:hypothetical protein